MDKPKFSIVMIAKNEANTLPRCMASLKDFTDRGGEVIVVDTGSTDGTADLARSLGCNVTEVGEKFITTIDTKTAGEINNHFLVDDEEPIVYTGNRLFDFASARNYATSLASNDFVFTLDADEVYTNLNIDEINRLIDQGYQQFEYQFVYAHDVYGRPAVQFVQSKAFDRRIIQWTGIVHEVLYGINAKRLLLAQNIVYLEHWQEPSKEHRGNYLVGLALDCYQNPEKDRQSHYLAREMTWTGRPKSAIKEFKRHISMNGWVAEKAQSMIYIGDCYGMIGQPEKQVEWYNKAFYTDPNRREALIKLARFYQHNNNPQATAVYAKAANEIAWTDYYANDRSMYEHEPHALLYWAYGWLGKIPEAREELLKALKYQPQHPLFLRDTKFYFEYPSPPIEGWMTYPEILYLYNTAKLMRNVCEVGSWKGRSTHALLSSGANVTAVDHFMGSIAEPDAHAQAKDGSVYAKFIENVGHFNNLTVMKMNCNDAVEKIDNQSFDMVFIDGGHTYEEVKNDIKKWKPKAKFLLCGHDYSSIWQGVKQAVDEEFGKPDGLADTIWYKWLVPMPKVSVVIPTLGREEKLERLIQSIKDNAQYPNYEIIVERDSFPPNNQGAPITLKKGVEKSTGELVMFLGNDCIPEPGFMMIAVLDMLRNFPEADGLVGLNDGYWQDEFYTHWLASKKLLPYLGGEFFHTGYYHTGCDNELTGKCKKIGKAFWSEKAKVKHDHPIHTNFQEEYVDEVYKLAYRKERLQHDRELLISRSKEFGFENSWAEYKPISPNPIPKKIFSIWLGDEMPEIVKKCIETHKIPGYEHTLITLDNCWRGSKYLNDCIESKNWVKAADFLRLFYLNAEGGIYFDADLEVLHPEKLDDLLNNKMFVTREDNGFIANGVIGSVKEHPILSDCLNEMDTKDGKDNKVFEYGMEIFTNHVYAARPEWGVKILTPDYFLPYNHQTGETKMTENTISNHYYLKSWKKDEI